MQLLSISRTLSATLCNYITYNQYLDIGVYCVKLLSYCVCPLQANCQGGSISTGTAPDRAFKASDVER